MAQEDRIYRKGELIAAAQPYAETSFTAVDVNTNGPKFYNSWSGMSTLIDKDFVEKSSSPARLKYSAHLRPLLRMDRYQLTDAGRELAAKMLTSWKIQGAPKSSSSGQMPVVVPSSSSRAASDVASYAESAEYDVSESI
jgi:hypothetical protein